MRPAAAACLALALALAVLVPAAQAQSASPSVTVTAEKPEGTVSIEHSTSFKVTVKNTSPSSGTPADAQDKADVAMRTAGAPAGWTVSTTPATFQLAPGESATVDVQVSVAAQTCCKSTVLTVSADLYSPIKGLEPILGAAGASQKASGDATLHLTLHDSVTRNVIEAVGPWIYAIVLLLIAAIIVAIAISVSARRTLVRLTAEAKELPVQPGGKVAFPFRAEGLARESDTVLLQVSTVQDGWAAFLPVPELVLEPGQVQDLTLVVIAPRGSAQGTRQAILVTATSGKAPKGAANLEFVARVEGPEDLPSAPRRPKSD